MQYTFATTSDYHPNRVWDIYNLTTGYSQHYEYDSNGYISKYVNNQNRDNYTYTYDSAGRLISDGTYTYTYENYNNLIRKADIGAYEYTYNQTVRTVIRLYLE